MPPLWRLRGTASNAAATLEIFSRLRKGTDCPKSWTHSVTALLKPTTSLVIVELCGEDPARWNKQSADIVNSGFV